MSMKLDRALHLIARVSSPDFIHHGCDERDELEEGVANLVHDIERAERRIQAVREMHDADGVRWVGFPRADEQVTYCTYCQERSPCATIRTLDGDA